MSAAKPKSDDVGPPTAEKAAQSIKKSNLHREAKPARTSSPSMYPSGRNTNGNNPPLLGSKPPQSITAPIRDQNMRDLGGSRYSDWNSLNSNLVQMALPRYLNPDGTPLDMQEITFAGLMSIDPQDVIEGMLAAQLIACHHASMACYRVAHLPDQTHEGRSEALSQAGKLSKTYASLVEALNRHRGKGQQKVTVEHVHVHSGGQAIVGTVTHPGGGVAAKTKE